MLKACNLYVRQGLGPVASEGRNAVINHVNRGLDFEATSEARGHRRHSVLQSSLTANRALSLSPTSRAPGWRRHENSL